MRIFTERGQRQQIAEYFGVSATMVSLALNFWKNGPRAREIRDYAVNELGCPYKLD